MIGGVFLVYFGYIGFVLTLCFYIEHYALTNSYLPPDWLIYSWLAVGVAGTVLAAKKKSNVGFIGMAFGSGAWIALDYAMPIVTDAAITVHDALGSGFTVEEIIKFFEICILSVFLFWFAIVAKAASNYRKNQVAVDEGIEVYTGIKGLKKRWQDFKHRLSGLLPVNVPPSITIGLDYETKRDVVMDGWHRYEGLLISGGPGTGKTSTGLARTIQQDLEHMADTLEKRLKKGLPIENYVMAMTVQEPKGDLIYDTLEWAERLGLPQMGVPVSIIDPNNENTGKINPLQGDEDLAAQAVTTVMKNIFGRQEAFFSFAQATTCTMTIKLVKQTRGDNIDLPGLVRLLQDKDAISNLVENLEYSKGQNFITHFFRKEYLNTNRKGNSALHDFAVGLRLQLEYLLSSERLSDLVSGSSTVELDHLLEKGGLLLINTDSLGRLGDIGDFFGQFLTQLYKGALFRRPGSRLTRIPAAYKMDEAHRYMQGVGFDTFTTVGRSYNSITEMVIQSRGQFEMSGQPKGFEQVMITSFRNLMIYASGHEDALAFSREFGDKPVMDSQPTYDGQIVMPRLFPKSVRHTKKREPYFQPAEIQGLPDDHFIYRVRTKAGIVGPAVAIGSKPKIYTPKEIKYKIPDLKSKPKSEQTVLTVVSAADKINHQPTPERSTAFQEKPPMPISAPPIMKTKKDSVPLVEEEVVKDRQTPPLKIIKGGASEKLKEQRKPVSVDLIEKETPLKKPEQNSLETNLEDFLGVPKLKN